MSAMATSRRQGYRRADADHAIRRVRTLAALGALLAAGCGAGAQGRPWVHKVTLVGVRHVDRRELQSRLALEQTSWVPLFPKRYLDPFTLQLDRKRIESFYQLRGFYRARVTALDVAPRKRASVDVTIVVAEGPATRIAEVQISGLEGLPGAGRALTKGLGLERGQIFDAERFNARADHLQEQLKALGHAWATVTATAEVNRDAGTARLTVVVAPGPMAYIARISSVGSFADTRRLQIHSGLVVGERLTPARIEAARSRLYSLGVFASVKVDYAPIAGRPGAADVTVRAQEGPLRELRLGVGFGLEPQRTEVRLRGIYTRHNFLGGLRTLRFTLEPSWLALPAFWNLEKQGPAGKAEAQFTQPDLLLPLDQLKLTAGYNLGLDYAYQYHGPSTQLAYSRPFFHDKLLLSASYNLQFLLFFNTDPAILANPDQAHRLFGYTDPYRVAWWQQDAVLDLRDRPLDARKGAYLAVTAEEGGAYSGSAFRYEKLRPEARGYLPFGRRVVLAVRAEFGQLFVQGDLGSPITRRFYLGGPDSHRGFTYNRLSMQVPSGLANAPPLPIGGDQMVLGQAELRVSVARLFGSWLEVAGFFDTGDVAAPSCQASPKTPTACAVGGVTTSSRIDLTRLHHAVGGGLRYKSVIGTIRADLGVRLNRLAPTERDGTPNPDPGARFAYHISIGEPF
jgi:outer membrane protein assembly factor BamA